jgi:hypothetical protein
MPVGLLLEAALCLFIAAVYPDWSFGSFAWGALAGGVLWGLGGVFAWRWDYGQMSDDDGEPPPFMFYGRSRLERLHRVYECLPAKPRPPEWGVAYVTKSKKAWTMDVGKERLIVEILRNGRLWVLRVFICTRGGEAPPSDERCSAILGQLRGVDQFVESAGVGGMPGVRSWVGMPEGQRPKFVFPGELENELKPGPLTPMLERAREHFPRKLPESWTVPIATTDPRGTEWKSGAWMFGVGEVIALVNLCASQGRTKLLVALFRPDGEDVGEAGALDVLRHFRGVYEFSQGERSADAPVVTYFGELQKTLRDPATLN